MTQTLIALVTFSGLMGSPAAATPADAFDVPAPIVVTIGAQVVPLWSDPFPLPVQSPGACILPNGGCQVMPGTFCRFFGGTFLGPDTTCP